MNAPTHTFPLPQAETTKLETVTQQFRHPPVYKRVNDFVRANPWPCILVAAALGFLAIKSVR